MDIDNHTTLSHYGDVDLDEIDDRIEILKQSLDELSESKELVLQYKIVLPHPIINVNFRTWRLLWNSGRRCSS